MKLQLLLMNFTIVATLAAAAPRLLAQTPAQNDAARKLFQEGWTFLDDRRFGDAERKFREALRTYPRAEQSDRTSYYLIDTLVKQGRTSDAGVEIQSFNRNYPQSRWKIDVDEVRMQLGFAPGYVFGPANPAFGARRVPSAPSALPVPPVIIMTVPMNPGVDQEVFRMMVLKDAPYAMAEARQRLKVNPSDPAVVSNFSTIAGVGTPQAFPFFVMLASDGPSPNTRVQARFWIYRLNNEQDAVGRGFVEMVKEKTIPAVVDVLSQANPDQRGKVLQQIVQTPSPEKVVGLEKVFKTTTVQPFRAQIVESTATMPESAALEFLTDVAKTEPEYIVRLTAIHALGARKDVDVKTLADILNAVSLKPVVPAVRVKKE